MRIVIATIILSIMGCSDTSPLDTSSKVELVTKTSENQVVKHPEWSKDATIYKVNIRQHTAEGTFESFEADMDRIATLGSEILWIMPMQTIGMEKRKAKEDLFTEDIENPKEGNKCLGSYYSISNYTEANPDFGTIDDFKSIVNKAHLLGQRVILDWVPNHTSIDNIWIKKGHKDWYTLDSLGHIPAPSPDGRDLAYLNYENDSMRLAMIEAMKFWITDVNIDGFRCDDAMEVPLDFWEQAIGELKKVKTDIFMLAESELPEHHRKTFDMTYGWYAHDIFNHIAKQEWPLDSLVAYMKWEEKKFSTNDYRMMFTSNHDENSWNGTLHEGMGENHKPMAVIAFTYFGMPLIYGGQELGNNRPLKSFEKDTIQKRQPELQNFYKTLITTKKENPALWNGTYGGRFMRINTSNDTDLLAIIRMRNDNEVITVINLSSKKQQVNFVKEIEGNFVSVFNAETLGIYTSGTKELVAHGYQVFVKK
ncbi:MAG: alpha-amylase family glycosyl hydrolase [Flavobacteriales bacterium]